MLTFYLPVVCVAVCVCVCVFVDNLCLWTIYVCGQFVCVWRGCGGFMRIAECVCVWGVMRIAECACVKGVAMFW